MIEINENDFLVSKIMAGEAYICGCPVDVTVCTHICKLDTNSDFQEIKKIKPFTKFAKHGFDKRGG